MHAVSRLSRSGNSGWAVRSDLARHLLRLSNSSKRRTARAASGIRFQTDPLPIGQRRYNEMTMDRVPPQPVKDPPNLIRSGSFSLDRLLSHIDPGPAEESEDFVDSIYGQRHLDLPSDRNGTSGR